MKRAIELFVEDVLRILLLSYALWRAEYAAHTDRDIIYAIYIIVWIGLLLFMVDIGRRARD